MNAIHPERDYMNFLTEGKFMLLRSKDSGKYIFYPRVVEPGTGSTRLEWVQASGRGSVYSTTVVRQRPPAADYNVAIVELAEGPRMFSRIDGMPADQVKIGMQVQAQVITENEKPMVVFAAREGT
jgi:uncharacterized OB-fold protein